MSDTIMAMELPIKHHLWQPNQRLHVITDIAGWVVSYTLLIHMILGESGTCNQNDTDSFLTSTIMGIVTFLATILLFRFPSSRGQVWYLGLPHIATFAYAGTILQKYLVTVTFNGLSPCLVRRPSLLAESMELNQRVNWFEGRMYAPAYFAICIALLYCCLKQWQTKKSHVN